MKRVYTMRSGVQKAHAKAKQFVSLITVTAASLGVATMMPLTANAAVSTSYSLFGDAAIVSGGNPNNAAQISNGAPGYGGVDYTGTGVITLADLTNLSTDYKFTQGSCEVGSPRFTATVTNGSTTGNIFFYLGAAPNYTNCPQNVWTNTGNLAAPTNLVDTSQLPGGAFYDTYAGAQFRYGSYTVTDLSVVSDDFLATQTVLLDNTQVNGTTFNYDQPANADSCKEDGWKTLADANGQAFKSQGQCVSFVATAGKH